MKIRLGTLLSVVVVLALLLPACSTPPSPEAPAPTTPPEATTPPQPEPTAAPASEIKRGGILKVGYEIDFENLDPYDTLQWADTAAHDLVYEGLVKWDLETLEPRPLLARSWEISDDGLTYTFYLEEGIKWHNGEDLTAEDVKYSFDRIMDPNQGSTLSTFLQTVDSVEIVDDYTVVLHLNQPFSPLLSLLPYVPHIVNKEFVEAAGGTTPRTMMGTGPYMFDEWIPDTVFRLVKNPEYWRMGDDGEALPYLDGIEFYPVVDETARVDDLLAGVVDFIVRVPEKDLDRLDSTPDIQLSAPWATWYDYVLMNASHPPFDDVRVREAVAWALDRDEMVQAASYGHGTPLYGGAIPSWHWAYNDLRVFDHQDVEKARQLLTDAGYPEGFEVTLEATSDYDVAVRQAELVVSYLAEVGIQVEVVLYDAPTFFDKMLAAQTTLAICGESPSGDPDDTYFMMFHSTGDWNYNDYFNPEVERLLEEGRRVSDLAERKEIYRQVEEIVLQDLPLAYMYLHDMQEAYYDYVKGYTHMGNNRYHGLIQAWLDQ